MSGPAWPQVYTGLLSLLPTLPELSEVAIFDGQPVSNDNPMVWITVGFRTDDGAGAYTVEHDPSGGGWVETGTVLCHVASNAGDTDPSVARDAAFGYVAAWQKALESDQTLGGVLTVGSVITLGVQVLGVQNEQGSATGLLVTVNYRTVTYYG